MQKCLVAVNNLCTDQLTFVDKVVDYKHWFFGHYRFDREISDKKTCLYQQIVKLQLLNQSNNYINNGCDDNR